MRDNRRRGQYEDREDRNRDADAHWLHGHHQGQNSDRGNYTVDTHFNRGYGRNEYDQYGDNASFNSNAYYRQANDEGRFGPGGANYAGEDFSRRGQNTDNPYGMTYIPSDRYNSGRHYDARADYSDHNYDDLRQNRQTGTPYRRPDERFGHDVRSGGDNENWARGSVGDYESYRRYEMGNRSYDNDYSGGFAGRSYTPGATHYGEGSYYSELDRWQQEAQQNKQSKPRGRRK